MARTVCKAFSIKLNSIMQRDSGKSKKSTSHLPSLPAHGQKASDTAEKVEFGLGPEPLRDMSSNPGSWYGCPLSFKAYSFLEHQAPEQSGAWWTPWIAVPIFWGDEGVNRLIRQVGWGRSREKETEQTCANLKRTLSCWGESYSQQKTWRRKEA